MPKFKLPRTKQCAKCPWKVSTNPYEIPDGYCEVKHSKLDVTINSGIETIYSDVLHAMACHHSTGDDKMYCVGWVHNQMGVGNNILLRLKMMNCENAKDIKVFGEQHKNFEDTLPKK